MNEIIQQIEQLFDKGVIPNLTAIAFGIASLILTIAKNKLSKKLLSRDDELVSLREENKQLKTKVEKLETTSENTNRMISSAIDMIHVAYSSSKLDVASKIQLQKIYDKCPESICESSDASLEKVIEQEATEEQVQKVIDSEPVSYAEQIAKKLE